MKVKLEITGQIQTENYQKLTKIIPELLKLFESYKYIKEENKGVEK